MTLPLLPTNRAVFMIFTVLSLIIMSVMNFAGLPLNTAAAPSGIVSFEIAGSAANAQAILASWDSAARVRAAFIQGLDFLFPPVYSTAVALGCLLASTALARRGSQLARFGRGLAWGQWAAAGFDYVENIALVALLFGAPGSPWPQIALACALVKFTLLFLGLVYCFFGLAMRAVPTAH